MASYIEQLAKQSATGQPFVAVTLIETVGSTPQDCGNKMLVDGSGLLYGTVGGGKIEARAIAVAQEMLSNKQGPVAQLIEWNLQTDVGMTCGGVVKLYIEAYNRDDWHVVIFGAGHVAQALVRCLEPLNCRLTCVDPRSEWLSKLPTSDSIVTNCVPEPKDFVEELTADDFVVCMTMGHSTDSPILAELFSRGIQPAYLGVIGSRSKRKILLRELAGKGIAPEQVTGMHCPIGLPIGTNQPGEIAISIVAQMMEVRDKRRSESK